MQFLEGYILGLGMIIFIGPVFFILISLTLQFGIKAGLSVALGIILSDIICVILCFYGVTSILQNSISVKWISLIGGIILLVLGINYIINPKPQTKNIHIKSYHYLKCFTKGFLVNFVNPFVFFVWIGVVTYSKKWEYYGDSMKIYLFGVILGIFTTDTLKVFTAKKINVLLNPNILKHIFRISGLILIVFGIRLLLIV